MSVVADKEQVAKAVPQVVRRSMPLGIKQALNTCFPLPSQRGLRKVASWN